jgi:heterodisulfide reductase subunit B
VRRYLYFPGCSLHSTAKEYELSLQAVAAALGIQLHEVRGWSCCGSSAAHGAGHVLATALAARNLNLAAAGNTGEAPLDLLVPCAACYSRLRRAQADLGRSEALRDEFRAVSGEPWRGGDVRVRSLLEALDADIGAAELKSRVTVPLQGLRVASYYGCLLVRPPELTGFDDAEDPMSLDRLVSATGAEAVWWPHKVECCGAGLSISRRDIVVRLVGGIVGAAAEAGAGAIVTACPMCHANLDTRQAPGAKAAPGGPGMPVLYLTQLLGLALGIAPRKLSLGSHLTSTAALARQIMQVGRPRRADGGRSG